MVLAIKDTSFEAESLYTQIVSAPFSLHALVPNLNPNSWDAGNSVLCRVMSICVWQHGGQTMLFSGDFLLNFQQK